MNLLFVLDLVKLKGKFLAAVLVLVNYKNNPTKTTFSFSCLKQHYCMPLPI